MTGDRFSSDDPALIADLIHGHPLAWIVPHAAIDAAMLMPLVVEHDASGAPTTLLGHLPKAARAASALAANPSATFLFLGPHRHIPNDWIRDRKWAPTWNFAAAMVEGTVSLDPDLADGALRTLVAHLGGDWSVDEMGPRYRALCGHVLGFRVHPDHWQGRFKLGQDERPENRVAIIDALGASSLASWMGRFADA